MIAVIQPPSASHAQAVNYWLESIKILGPFVFGLASGWILGRRSHILNISRDDRNRIRKAKDDFLAAVTRIESDLHACGHVADSKTPKIYADSVIKLRPEIFRVKTFIGGDSFDRLLELWKQYEKEDTSATDDCKRAVKIQGITRPEPQYAKARILDYLDSFKKEVG